MSISPPTTLDLHLLLSSLWVKPTPVLLLFSHPPGGITKPILLLWCRSINKHPGFQTSVLLSMSLASWYSVANNRWVGGCVKLVLIYKHLGGFAGLAAFHAFSNSNPSKWHHEVKGNTWDQEQAGAWKHECLFASVFRNVHREHFFKKGTHPKKREQFVCLWVKFQRMWGNRLDGLRVAESSQCWAVGFQKRRCFRRSRKQPYGTGYKEEWFEWD